MQGVQDGGNWVFVQRGYDLSNDELREIQMLKANVIDWPYTGALHLHLHPHSYMLSRRPPSL